MSNPIKWAAAAQSRGVVVDSGINSLADGSRTNAGTEIDNSTNLDQYGMVQLDVTFSAAPTANGYVGIYMVSALDGTNYEDGSSSVDPGAHNLVATIPVRAVTTAQRLTSPVFALKPAKCKFIVQNKAGSGSSAMAASGNQLTLYTANDTVT
jgi:hypothetical protein